MTVYKCLLPIWCTGKSCKVASIASLVSATGGTVCCVYYVEKNNGYTKPAVNFVKSNLNTAIKSIPINSIKNSEVVKSVTPMFKNVPNYFKDFSSSSLANVKGYAKTFVTSTVKHFDKLPEYTKTAKEFVTANVTDENFAAQLKSLKESFDNFSVVKGSIKDFFIKTVIRYGKSTKDWIVTKWDAKDVLQGIGNTAKTIKDKPGEITAEISKGAQAIWKHKDTFGKFITWIDANKISQLWQIMSAD